MVTADTFRAGLIFGEPGVGKTSILHAGVIPALRERRVLVMVCRDLGAPAQSFAAEIEAQVAVAPNGTFDVTVAYDPSAVRIDSFKADATNITWTSTYAESCHLFNDEDRSVLVTSVAGLGGGVLAHGQTGGTELFLICMGSAGEPAVAVVTVP